MLANYKIQPLGFKGACSSFIMTTKHVTWSTDTIDPPEADKCACCGHRNIIPQIRPMELCMECFRLTCIGCWNSMGICKVCEEELFGEETVGECNTDDYEEITEK